MTLALLQSSLLSFSNFHLLSEGKFTTCRVADPRSKQDVVLKIFPENKASVSKFETEKTLLQSFKHPNLISLVEAVDQISPQINPMNNFSYLVLEYASHGDLTDIIQKNGPMSELLARSLFKQLVEAVSYMHSNRIAHLDLKPDNLLIDRNYNLKVADFDLSQNFDTKAVESKGTPGYRAPEIVDGKCEDFVEADVYSMGIILFVLVTGNPPYSEKQGKFDWLYKLLHSNEEKFWNFHCYKRGSWDFYSEDLKGLLKLLLEADPKKRATVVDIKNSVWYQGKTLDAETYKKEMASYIKK